MTTINTVLLGAAMTFIGLGVTTVASDWIAGTIEFAIGLVAILIYEKLPASTPPPTP